jgi:hypothetical protein
MLLPEEEEKKETPGRKEIEEKGRRDFPRTYVQLENCKDFSVKHKFHINLKPNEEMPKMKVGEFFKLYNIALGLKFKN